MSITVKFRDSRMQPAHERTMYLGAVPRVGDRVHWAPDDPGFAVKSVAWVLLADGETPYVIVRGW